MNNLELHAWKSFVDVVKKNFFGNCRMKQEISGKTFEKSTGHWC